MVGRDYSLSIEPSDLGYEVTISPDPLTGLHSWVVSDRFVSGCLLRMAAACLSQDAPSRVASACQALAPGERTDDPRLWTELHTSDAGPEDPCLAWLTNPRDQLIDGRGESRAAAFLDVAWRALLNEVPDLDAAMEARCALLRRYPPFAPPTSIEVSFISPGRSSERGHIVKCWTTALFADGRAPSGLGYTEFDLTGVPDASVASRLLADARASLARWFERRGVALDADDLRSLPITVSVREDTALLALIEAFRRLDQPFELTTSEGVT